MKENQKETKENERKKIIGKGSNLILNEQLENCFITISKTQTEDEQSNSRSQSQFHTEKSRQIDEDVSERDSAGAGVGGNDSRFYGKKFSDRISIEDSADLSLGKNLLHKIPNIPSSKNKEIDIPSLALARL